MASVEEPGQHRHRVRETDLTLVGQGNAHHSDKPAGDGKYMGGTQPVAVY